MTRNRRLDADVASRSERRLLVKTVAETVGLTVLGTIGMCGLTITESKHYIVRRRTEGKSDHEIYAA